MSSTRQMVMVGEAMRPGSSLDEVMDRIVAASGSASITVAVLDRVDGRTCLAVGFEGDAEPGPETVHRIVAELEVTFNDVSVVRSPSKELAGCGGLT